MYYKYITTHKHTHIYIYIYVCVCVCVCVCQVDWGYRMHRLHLEYPENDIKQSDSHIYQPLRSDRIRH